KTPALRRWSACSILELRIRGDFVLEMLGPPTLPLLDGPQLAVPLGPPGVNHGPEPLPDRRPAHQFFDAQRERLHPVILIPAVVIPFGHDTYPLRRAGPVGTVAIGVPRFRPGS